MFNSYIKNRTPLMLVGTVLGILLFTFTSLNFAENVQKNDILSVNQNSSQIEIINVSINQGSSASDIASLLSSEGVVTSQLAFELYLRSENLTDKLRAGDYEIANNLEFSEITAILLKGPPLKTYTITIPEGLWITETLLSISSQTGFDYDLLLNSLLSGQVESEFLYLNDPTKLSNWEGLLYPNTYQINLESNGEEILQIMVNELESVTAKLLSEQQLPTWIETYNELFIVASLVEAESKIQEDRPLVSSVVKNRIQEEMLIQIDATVLYALQKRKSQVLLVDLQIDSEYNTYKYLGLPPTPISGFGERSIQAVLDTPENDFLYYLLTEKNGKMSFTNDYTEFINLKNKAKEEGVIP
tara:strand:+ start:3006 stop:4079 length:1074 start_codon:yes stop_codon:yes gene_type:complete